MPQDLQPTKAEKRRTDKEAKRARGSLSCAECRRLKLKCDKTVPCGSCTRRGCGSICPNGELVTGGGTRFVLANTEELHNKIKEMGDRIQALEDALRISYSSQSNEPHPLLSREHLGIKSALNLHSAVKEGGPQPANVKVEEDTPPLDDAFGTLAINTETGSSTFYGRSAGSESLLMSEKEAYGGQSLPSQSFSGNQLGSVIANFPNSFPFPSSSPTIPLNQLIQQYLPPWEQASHFCRLYTAIAPWFYGAVTIEELEEEILPRWYDEAPRPIQNGTSPAAPKLPDAHETALLFIILCFGALIDTTQPAAPENPVADHFYQLTKAALTLEPVTEKPATIATVQTLSMMGIYQGLCNSDNSIESMWTLYGLSTKLAQSVGLHNDSARWKLSPRDVQKRRALFWELFITDGWQSLSTGRLATFALPYVDCELPQDKGETLDADGNPQPSFPFWKARFGAECVSAIVENTLTAHAPKYSIIIELDRKVRNMVLPQYAQGEPPHGETLNTMMMYFMPHNYRDLSLLYVHRCFFSHAILSHPLDPLKSQYAPSFLAGYRSSTEIIKNLQTVFSLFPQEIARFWILWTHAFSGTIMLASVVTHAPKSRVAQAALVEIKSAMQLFEKAAKLGGRAMRFKPILQKLLVKAEKTYLDTRQGIPPPTEKNILKPKPEGVDELSIFSGKTNTVLHSDRPTTITPSSSQALGPQAVNSDVPLPPPTPAFHGAHPGLINDYTRFETDIEQRLQDAQMEEQNLFSYVCQSSQSPETSSPSYPAQEAPPSRQSEAGYPQAEYAPIPRQRSFSARPISSHQSQSPQSSTQSHYSPCLAQSSPAQPEIISQPVQNSALAYEEMRPSACLSKFEQQESPVYPSPSSMPGPDIRYHYSHLYNAPPPPPPHSYYSMRQLSSPAQVDQQPLYEPDGNPSYAPHAVPGPPPDAHYHPGLVAHGQPVQHYQQQQQLQQHMHSYELASAVPPPPMGNQPDYQHRTLRQYHSHPQLLSTQHQQQALASDDPELQATWNQFNFSRPGALPGLQH